MTDRSGDAARWQHELQHFPRFEGGYDPTRHVRAVGGFDVATLSPF